MAVSIIIILSLFLGILTVGIADLLERQTHKRIVKAIYTQNAANPIHVSFAHESKV